MIETYLWKQLVALAKYGTLSEVANRLNLSQSALSRSMQKLEQHIGVELFVRKKNSIALNDNGILAVPHEHHFATKDGIFLEELNGEKVLLYSKIGFWYRLCLMKAPNAKLLMQSERDVFKEFVEVSPFLSFTTDVLIKTGLAQKNYLYKPILNSEANVTYYCVCKSNQKNRFKNLFTKLPSQNSPNQKSLSDANFHRKNL